MEKNIIKHQYNKLQGFLAKPPRGVGFYFQFSDEASSKKNPTPPGVFPNSGNLLGIMKFLGWGFFFMNLHFFEASSKKNPTPWGVSRGNPVWCIMFKKVIPLPSPIRFPILTYIFAFFLFTVIPTMEYGHPIIY